MVTAIVGVLGGLSVVAWLVVAWQSRRRQPWLLAPLPLLTVLLLALGWPGWALVPTLGLLAGVFTELVIGAREPPALRAREPEAALSTERWAAAVAAPFRTALAEPWDVIAHTGLRRRYRRALARELGVVDRASLLHAVDRLWQRLQDSRGVDLALDLRTGTAVTQGLRNGSERRMLLPPDRVVRLRRVTGAGPDTERVVLRNVHTWHAVHLVRLACGGQALDWLSPAESTSLLRRVATDLQRRYADWQQLAQSLHGGFLIWPPTGARGDAERVWTALGLLLSDPDSPWLQLPWDMPLERAPSDRPVPSVPG